GHGQGLLDALDLAS
nr:Chain P, ExoS (416-430) peptide [synthetic construct]2O02_Q Chain Q, ExoS (416-430) peptide [synthetic construct]